MPKPKGCRVGHELVTEQQQAQQALVLPCGSDGKEYDCNAGNLGSIPGLERSPGE